MGDADADRQNAGGGVLREGDSTGHTVPVGICRGGPPGLGAELLLLPEITAADRPCHCGRRKCILWAVLFAATLSPPGDTIA